MRTLDVLIPVLGRPHRVKEVVASLHHSIEVPTRVLFITDPDDADERKAVVSQSQRCGNPLFQVDLPFDCAGNYAQKINAGVRHTEGPFTNAGHRGDVAEEGLIFLGADDLKFHKGWFSAATAQLLDGIGVVGTNDICNERVIAGEHSTHSLVTRAYVELGTIDDPTKLLHEAYPHEFVDDEFVETAKHRGAYAHAGDAIVEHLHPMVGKAEPDALYNGIRGRMHRGRPIYRERKPLWT